MELTLGKTDQRVQFALWAVVVLGGCKLFRKSCRKGKSLAGLPEGPEPLEPRSQPGGISGVWQHAWGFQDDFEHEKKATSIHHSIDSAGHPVAIITKPMLLAKMEAESGAVTTTIARESRLRSLTGIQNVGRLTEVMEQTLIPLIIRELSPNGLTSSGLMTHFDQHLRASLLENPGIDTTSLSDFTGRHTFRAVAGALFGPTFPVSAFEDYALFVKDMGRIDGPFSNWVPSTRRLRAGRQRIMAAFSQYLEEWWYADGLHTIPGISPLVRRLLHGAKDEELDLEEACGGLLAFLYDAHFNLWSTTAGLISQILMDPSAHQRVVDDVRAESTYCFSRLLDSATYEALRWQPGERPQRHLSQDAVFNIDGMQHALKNGTKLVLDLWGLHFDADVYGDPLRFDVTRFLDDSLPLPRSFGEGKRMCKGAYLARLQVKSFLYHAFRTCDFNFTLPENMHTEKGSSTSNTSRRYV
ncbi:cytochrome P450 [Coprinellus micaceus]|uniref:Cytochrome P450 n=1 Tax=Coprinellus micaceus TaxID=71717 RepID=A0A4Y7SPV0_COPMI|nr:cytochrome P450 [Coprinellus micaceus]